MTHFDLTFKGTILPDHDPQQVKARFADLFDIKDPFILEQLFSGDTFVLRSNLERKVAADYFRKVVEIGGQAELVASSAAQQTAEETDKENVISRVAPVAAGGNGNAEVLNRGNGHVEQSWPVSAARKSRSPNLSVVSNRKQETPEDAARASQEEQLRTELAELRLARDNVEAQAATTLASLDQENVQREEKFHLELKQVQTMRTHATEKGEKALADIELKIENAQQYAGEQQQQLQDELQRKADEVDQSLQELEREAESSASSLQVEIAEIQQSIDETSSRADEAVARLEQLIEETRRQAEIDLAELDTQMTATSESLESNSQELTTRRKAMRQQAEADSTGIQTRIDEIQLRNEEQLAELSQALEAEQGAAREAVGQLEDMEGEVELRWGAALGEVEVQVTETQRNLEQELERLAAEEASLRHKLSKLRA